jgi:glyoxylase-like metal-dependent hydrolase (beta-lactamase superfamily II)
LSARQPREGGRPGTDDRPRDDPLGAERPRGRTVLVDAGFYRQEVLKYFGVTDFTRPDKALERLGIKPDEVTDVILTHMHSDHVDGADLFPMAQIWIQKEEYAHYAEKTGRPGGGLPGSEPEYIRALVRLHTLGRVHLVDGDAREIIPGVTVYTGGKHTFASQYVGVNTKAGTVVIASDNVYTYENLEKHVPITATLDAKSNLAAIRVSSFRATIQGCLSGSRNRAMAWPGWNSVTEAFKRAVAVALKAKLAQEAEFKKNPQLRAATPAQAARQAFLKGRHALQTAAGPPVLDSDR